jgi:hypothetical protein
VILPTIDRYPRGAYIHLGSLWGTSHFHWVLEVLTRCAIVERASPALSTSRLRSSASIGSGSLSLMEATGAWSIYIFHHLLG